MSNVRDFGAIGTGVHDDTDAFASALQSVAGGGECFVPAGTYLIARGGVTVSHRAAVTSNVRFFGESGAALKIAGTPTFHFLQCDGDNWQVDNLAFDMGDYTPATIGHSAIMCKGNAWRVQDCQVLRSGRWGISAYGRNDWEISGNSVERTVPGAQPPIGANSGHSVSGCLVPRCPAHWQSVRGRWCDF